MTERSRKLKREVVTTKDSVNPMGRSGAGMAVQNCPILKQGARPFYPHTDQSLGVGCSLQLEQGKKRNSAENCKLQIFSKGTND